MVTAETGEVGDCAQSFSSVAQGVPTKEGAFAAYLYTSQARQTYRESVRGVFVMSDDVSSPCIEIPGWKEGVCSIGARRLSEMKRGRKCGRGTSLLQHHSWRRTSLLQKSPKIVVSCS
jgi:hypothetical protein